MNEVIFYVILACLAVFVVNLILYLVFRKKVSKQSANLIKQANDANAAKTDFISRLSHDLRTPLSAIVGLTEIASINLDNKEILADNIEEIKQCSKFLLDLINDILEISSIEGGKAVVARNKIDLFKLVSVIKNITSVLAKDKELNFSMQVDKTCHRFIFGDELKIKQILVNLISNSLKFTESNGYITVNISESSGDDGKLRLNLKISDTGHGMAPEFIKKMYLPFEQEMSGEKYAGEGTGLGLTIVKNYIEMMNGTIRVDSVPEKGTTFYLSIPVEVSEESVQELLDRADSVKDDLFTGKRILLVDDNSINLRITEKLLRSKNFEVDTAENGKAAVDKYFSSPAGYYFAVLLDIRMPVMDGYEAARIIRSYEKTRQEKIPIIAFTANAFAEDIKKIKDSGIEYYLTKPIESFEMFSLLAKIASGEA